MKDAHESSLLEMMMKMFIGRRKANEEQEAKREKARNQRFISELESIQNSKSLQKETKPVGGAKLTDIGKVLYLRPGPPADKNFWPL